MAKDYYSTLGVSKTASPEEIKRAYRRLAHEHHPDKGNGNEEKFKEINEAYQVLSNPEKRQQYDQFGTAFDSRAGAQGFSGFDPNDFMRGFGFSGSADFEDAFDIFSDMFGRPARTRVRRERGVDLEMEINLSFEEAVFGTEKDISLEKRDVCQRCKGSGAEVGSKVSTCPKCHGTGQIRTSRRTIFGQIAQVAACDECEGSGKVAEIVCSECQGSGIARRTKRLKVKIPAGVDDDSRLRIPGEGEAGYKGSNFGDLYLRINVAPHSTLQREGFNILSELPLSFYQAALGTQVEVETVDGRVNLKIPAGTQSEKTFRLKGKGVPIMGRSGRGDHLVTVHVITPTKLTKKEKELFKKLAGENGESVDVDESFWGKFKS
ncbi:MAG: molecular chaperone DnaJ [Candidatus Doudnabacteria bacterium]|nr:molecular chaperone DnaJ [Candidatus Doudnabacteria bacterium]